MPIILALKTWWSSTNPFGTWSAIAVVISAAAWFVVDSHMLRSERAQGWLTIIAPLVLLGLVCHSKIHIDWLTFAFEYGWRNSRYHQPDAQDFFADYTFIAVALVLARKAAWLRSRDLRVLGIMELVTAVGFLGLEIRLLYEDLYT